MELRLFSSLLPDPISQRSKAVLCQPGHCFFDHVGDVCAVGRNDRLLLQPLVEIHMLDLGNGVFQIIIVIRKARIRLDLADAVSLQDSAYGNTMVYKSFVLIL